MMIPSIWKHEKCSKPPTAVAILVIAINCHYKKIVACFLK